MRPSRIVLLLVAIIGRRPRRLPRDARRHAPAAGRRRPARGHRGSRRPRSLSPTRRSASASGSPPDTVEWQDWPEGAVRPEYITIANVPDALDRDDRRRRALRDLPGRADPRAEARALPTRAISRRSSTRASAASRSPSAPTPASGGFIVPNDHVDVVLTRAGIRGQVSETILRNVKVLAIGTRLGETRHDRRAGRSREPARRGLRRSAPSPRSSSIRCRARRSSMPPRSARSRWPCARSPTSQIDAERSATSRPTARPSAMIRFGSETERDGRQQHHDGSDRRRSACDSAARRWRRRRQAISRSIRPGQPSPMRRPE